MIFTSMLISSWNEISIEKWKLLLFQYLLPMFAFILGYVIFFNSSKKDRFVELGILTSVGIIVPLQLLSTWMHRAHFHGNISRYPNIIIYMEKLAAALHEKVFFFSIYQHLQYVPSILVGAYFFSLISLWEFDKIRIILLTLTPIVGVYAIASTSRLALGGYLLGVIIFFIQSLRNNRFVLPSLLLILSLLLPYEYFMIGTKSDKGDNILNKKYEFILSGSNDVNTRINSSKMTPSNKSNLEQNRKTKYQSELPDIAPLSRIGYWHYYFKRITENSWEFLLGHSHQPDINVIPSAHNYYMDFIYNFGFISFTPLFFTLVTTVWLIFSNLILIVNSPKLTGLTYSVIYFLFADNMLKVGMRQLYPGIASFFLWGLLIRCLLSIHTVEVMKREKNNI